MIIIYCSDTENTEPIANLNLKTINEEKCIGYGR